MLCAAGLVISDRQNQMGKGERAIGKKTKKNLRVWLDWISGVGVQDQLGYRDRQSLLVDRDGWWSLTVIPALSKWRQESHGFSYSLADIERP